MDTHLRHAVALLLVLHISLLIVQVSYNARSNTVACAGPIAGLLDVPERIICPFNWLTAPPCRCGKSAREKYEAKI
jgi:hypothetical protein